MKFTLFYSLVYIVKQISIYPLSEAAAAASSRVREHSTQGRDSDDDPELVLTQERESQVLSRKRSRQV